MKYLTLSMMFFANFAMAETGLSISDARIMITPPGVPVTAGLMTISNSSDRDISVTNVTAKGFDRVEIHKSEESNGVARMREVKELKVPANGSIILENGGYHLMLYTPAQSYAVGDAIEITLHSDTGLITESVPIASHFD